MEQFINIQDLLERLTRRKITAEELLDYTLQNLYLMEKHFRLEKDTKSVNSVRSTIAYTKLLYDYEQQMRLARAYLLHKIKILEVRERDTNLEASILRGRNTPPMVDSPGSLINELRNKTQNEEGMSDVELNIIMDTKMIGEIDLSRAALSDISQRLESKIHTLSDIERQMDDMSHEIKMVLEKERTIDSNSGNHNNNNPCGVERT